ncbi:MAG: DUF4145 domain-containing protein [Planctomycetota bacterium]
MSPVPSPDSNFAFLADYDRRVGRLGQQAESYVHTDPDSCLFKLRLMIETMAKRLVEMELPHLVSSDLSTMLRSLERSGTLPRRQADGMHAIRRDGNAAVHGHAVPPPTAMRRLRDAHGLAAWFLRLVRRGGKVKVRPFEMPARPRPAGARVRAAIERAEALEDEIEARRRRTREALLLFGTDDDTDAEVGRLHRELEALDRVAAEAGEPLVDADSVMLVMAMELEKLLQHPRLGLCSRGAREEAGRQLDDVKRSLEDREQQYADERARLADEAAAVDDGS